MPMLTRKEIVNQLKRLGIKEPSLVKICLADFENYMERNYGLKIVRTRKIKKKK